MPQRIRGRASYRQSSVSFRWLAGDAKGRVQAPDGPAVSIPLLRRCEQERTQLAMHRAIARDLPRIINSGAFLEYPACSCGDHVVQVLHLCAVSGDEGVVGSISYRRKTDDCAAVIDRRAVGTRSAERA